MPVEKILIEVGVDDKKLDSILDKLVKAGQLSKQQADQFRGDSKKFEDAARKRAQLLKEEIQDLTELKLRKKQAFSTKEIEEFNRRIRESERRIESLGGEVKRQRKSMSAFDDTLKNLGRTIFAAFTVDRLIQFSIESVKLAAKVEGVERAFIKLDRPDLLKNIRAATRGTVSDLELMKSAVRANNFKIPLEKLATYFEFATNRSIETGESVDYLVNSIVDGIGRKSTLVLDNLGISASELQREIRKTGDFGEAAGNIIAREIENAGEVADSTAIRILNLATVLENFKARFGAAIISIVPQATGVQDLAKIEKAVENLNKAIDSGEVTSEAQKKRFKELLAAYELEEKALKIKTGSIKGDSKLREENSGRILRQTDAFKKLLEAYNEFSKDQRLKESIKSLTERIDEAEKAIGQQVSQSDKASASFGIQTGAVTKLLENFDKYLLLIDEGVSIIDAFIAVNQKEFAVFEQKNAALKEERLSKEFILELNEKLARQAKEDLKGSFIPTESDAEKANRIAEELLQQSIDNDAKFAENFDQAQADIDGKKKKFAQDDMDRAQEVADFENELYNKRLDVATAFTGALVALAKDNAEAQRAFLLFEKLIAIFRIVINGRAAAARALAELGPIAGGVAAARIRAITSLSVAEVAAQTIPVLALKEGAIDLQGPGTSTSDSIPAKLSKGESVMTAKETARHKNDLQAIRMKRWEDHVFHNYQLPFLKNFLLKNEVTNEFNDRNLLTSQHRMRQEIKGLRADLNKYTQHQLSTR